MHLPEKLSLPCQPRVVALLMNELRSTNPSLRRLNQLFGSDPVLAAWLLEQANAGIYQLSGMVQTIPQAVALLGVAQLRNLQKRALGHIAQRIPGLEQLGPFSCDCARLARSFASALSLDGGLAYTAGLLHGLGQIVFLQTQPQVQAVTKMESWAMGPWDPLRAQWERKHFGYTATQACAKLLAQWGIPTPVTQLIDALEQPLEMADSIPWSPYCIWPSGCSVVTIRNGQTGKWCATSPLKWPWPLAWTWMWCCNKKRPIGRNRFINLTPPFFLYLQRWKPSL